MRGLICGDLRLSLRLATRGRDERTVTVAAPSNDVKALLTLVRLQLEAHPPAAAIEAVRVAAVPERLRAAQLDLFRPSGPAPARLAVTLARLTAICGADRVGVPVVADSHRPDAYGVRRLFRGARWLGWSYGVKEEQPSPPPNPLTPNTLTPCSIIPLALRAIRPPQAVEVFCARDRRSSCAARTSPAASCTPPARGACRASGGASGRYARDYYDAQLSDGCVYRLYCDRAARMVRGGRV